MAFQDLIYQLRDSAFKHQPAGQPPESGDGNEPGGGPETSPGFTRDLLNLFLYIYQSTAVLKFKIPTLADSLFLAIAFVLSHTVESLTIARTDSVI